MTFRLFPAFFEHPTRLRFAEQEDNEVIDLFLRQHPIVNVPWIITALLAFFVPPLFIQFDQLFGMNFLINMSDTALIGFIIIYYLLLLAFVIEQFLYWYFNIYVITNLHLVDINFESILTRSITEVEIKDVQSQQASVVGIFESLFNYGDVIVKTAAERQEISFLKVPKPDFVADRIQDMQAREEGGL